MPTTKNLYQEPNLEIINLNKNQLNQVSSLHRWHLDSPKQDTTYSDAKNRIHIRGWVLCNQASSLQVAARTSKQIQYFNLSEARPDVIRRILHQDTIHHPQLICGFDFEINDWSSGVDIGFQTGNDLIWTHRIKIKKTIKVEEGKRNWLYLGNDTNLSSDQYTGKTLLSTQASAQWKDYFNKLESDSLKLGFRWAFLIAPAKEFIFSEYYPFQKGELTPVDQLIASQYSYGKLVWPYNALDADRELTYWKGDTHWTDYGGAIAARETLKTLGFENCEPDASIKYFIKCRAGDLGGKFSPPRISPVLTADFTPALEKKIFDNQIHNHGRIRIYENRELEHTQTCCILFGDSFGVNVTPWLVKHFSRLIYIHSAAAFDESILRIERPTHVILQTNSRFIIKPPELNFSIRPSIEGKLKNLGESEIKELGDNFQSLTNHNINFYKNLMLDLLKNTPSKHKV